MRKASVCCAGSENAAVGLDDQIRLAEQPSIGELSAAAAGAVGSPSGVPFFAHCSINAISRSVSGRWPTKWPTPGSTFHGGMKRLRVTCGDLRGPAADFVVGRQAERTGTARAMAGRAGCKHDRRDVSRERYLRARFAHERAHSAQRAHVCTSGEGARAFISSRSEMNAADRACLRDRHWLSRDHGLERSLEIANGRLRAILAELDIAIVNAAAIQHLVRSSRRSRLPE